MCHYLGRKASIAVLHDVDRSKSPLTDHESVVELFLSSPASISSSSSCSRFPRLSMTVWDGQEVVEFRLRRKILKDFFGIFLCLLNLFNVDLCGF